LLTRHREKYFHSIYNPVSLIRFSVGCPFSCSFCILWKLTDRNYITKTIDRIVEEVYEITTDNLYVTDDEAFIQAPRMNDLADEICRLRLQKKFHMYLRADTAVRNASLMEKWANAGLHSVLVGAESFSDRDLAEYNKKATADDNYRAFSIFHNLGVKVRANFIVRPDFDVSDFERLAEMVVKLKVDLPSFAVLTPLPGTDLFEMNQTNLISKNLELFDCYHALLPTKLPLQEFYYQFSQLLVNTSAANSANKNTGSMFYYSNSDAFKNMTDKIQNAYTLY
jgi:methyltransferase